MAAWAAAIPALAAAGGAILQHVGGAKANKHNQHLMELQQKENRKLMKKRHQWEVADLRKAGLNPILSAHAAPAMATSQLATSRNENEGVSNAVSSGVNSAIDTQRLDKEIQGTNSQISLNAAAAQAQTAQALNSAASAKKSDTETRALESQIPAIKSKAKFQKDQSEFDHKMLQYDNIQRRLKGGLDTFNSGASLVHPAKQLKKFLPKPNPLKSGHKTYRRP